MPHTLYSYEHNGVWLQLSETTVDSLTSLLRATHVPTKLRLTYVTSALFPLPGQYAPSDRPLIQWQHTLFCRHGHQHRLSVGSAHCACQLNPPPATEAVVDAFIAIVNKVVEAQDAYDWAAPPVDLDQQNVGDDGQPICNTTLVGEFFAEIEFLWKVILKRVPGAVGDEGQPGPKPRWWADGGLERARRANAAWYSALMASSARGDRPWMSGVGGPDPTPFYCTAFLLSHDVFEEWSAGGLDADDAEASEVAYDLEGGVFRLVPVEPAVAAAHAPPAAPPAAAPAVFERGQRVRIHGLKGRADLNGRVGVVLSPPADGRYPVKVRAAGGDDESVRIKAANIERVE